MTTLHTHKSDDERLSDIEEKLDKLTADVSDLVAAWKAASWLVSAVKWIGGVATAVTAVIILFRGFK